MSSSLGTDKYLATDTIVAPASQVGGAIAVVRLSGPRALEIAASLMSPESLSRLRQNPRAQVHLLLRSPSGAYLDDCLATFFAPPKSFTGEESVEFMVHGNPYIVRSTVESLITSGARPALPGEFTFRAMRNGRISLSQAQAIGDLHQARTSEAVQLAITKLQGVQHKWVTALASEMRDLAAMSELGIDFSDQDVDDLALQTLKRRAKSCIQLMEAMSKTYSRGAFIQDGFKVVLIGPPNAGKSSLFNAILGEDRSIVTSIPGTTRDVVRHKISLRSGTKMAAFEFSDTAGLRPTHDLVESFGVQRTLEEVPRADIVLLVLDPGFALDNIPELTKSIQLDPSRTIGIRSKADLLPLDQTVATPLVSTPAASRLDPNLGIAKTWIQVSSKTNQGLTDLTDAMVTIANELAPSSPNELLLTRLEHKLAVDQAATHLQRSLCASSEELFAADVRHALIALEPLIGETLTEDLLGQIFGSFCIGK